MWKIKKTVKKGDYLYAVVKEHPNSSRFGYVLMHRIVMENHLGRLLENDEIVHHKNGNKKDNRIENLEVMTQSEHTRHHCKMVGVLTVVLKCPWCCKIFTKRNGETHLYPKARTNYTACSKTCVGKFTHLRRYNPKEAERRISTNFICKKRIWEI